MAAPSPGNQMVPESQFQAHHQSYPPQQYPPQSYQQPRPPSQAQTLAILPPHQPHGVILSAPSPQLVHSSQPGIPPGYQISPHPANMPQIHSQQAPPPISQHNYSKLSQPHQVAPSGHPIMRPSQHQIAQHLMNPQAHIRSQRILQQQQFQHHQQQQQLQRHEEALSITDPLDCFGNRHLAIRRYTTNHAIMNSLFANPYTVNDVIKKHHILAQKPKPGDSSLTSNSSSDQQLLARKERLKEKLETIQAEISQSRKLHQAQVSRILSGSPSDRCPDNPA